MNIQKMLKQAQQMQQKVTDIQEQLSAHEVDGSAGGDMVKITINGKGEMRKLTIDPSLMTPDEKDMLEDLIIAAYNDAKRKADDHAANEMGSVTSGMGLPPGMKLPF